jgi:hypothetical protein
MVYQSNSNGYCAFKVQSALGSQASGGSAEIFRTTGTGGGGKFTKAATESNEVRRDGMRSRGRHGTYKTQGSQGGQLALGAYDTVFQALMRGTYGTADLAITEASVIGGSAAATSITTTTSTIVAAAGSWITQGLHVGDVIRLTGQATSTTNNSKDLRITGLTALVITVAETLVLNAVADTSFTVTRPGRVLINPAAGSIVKRYYTWEEYEVDIDSSSVYTDAVFGNGKVSMATDGIIMFDAGWWGTGQFTTLSGASAPLFTSPTENTATAMSVVDATIRLGSTDLVELSSFDLTFDISANAPSVFGSGAIKYSPDVFTGQMGINMNLTMLRKDLSYVANHINEDVLSLHILAVENEAEPKDFISFYVPNFTLGDVAKSALSKTGGGMTQTLQIPVALVGKDDTGGAYDATMLKIQVSNAS